LVVCGEKGRKEVRKKKKKKRYMWEVRRGRGGMTQGLNVSRSRITPERGETESLRKKKFVKSSTGRRIMVLESRRGGGRCWLKEECHSR